MNIVSKNEVCNLALSRIGNYDSISDIDTPLSEFEKVFAKWYDLAREITLKELAPNFALSRASIAVDAVTPAFGYSYQYAYPDDCLRVLGFGQVQEKQNVFAVEGDYILTDETDGGALELRYVKNITDVTRFYPEFVDALSFVLAYYTNMEITQDVQKQTFLEKGLPIKKAGAAALSGQENRPIRITRSKFQLARISDQPKNYNKL